MQAQLDEQCSRSSLASLSRRHTRGSYTYRHRLRHQSPADTYGNFCFIHERTAHYMRIAQSPSFRDLNDLPLCAVIR